MKKFNYEARDQASNKLVKSVVQAESERVAAKILMDQGLTPLSMKEQDASGDGLISKIANRVTTKDKVVFTRQLATLLGAGLPLSQSLNTVMEQTGNKKLKSVVQDVSISVEGGKSLSESFAKHPDIFNEVFLSLVAAGELSGTLDEALKRIASQQEKDAATASKIKSALTYPVIVVFVIIGVIIFMMVTVVPQVEKLYSDMDEKLPILTQIMVMTADFIASYWWLVILVLGVLIYFLSHYFKTDGGIAVKDNFKLKVPVFGKMFHKLYMARLSRTGQTLLSTGVSMLDMLTISGRAINNTIVEKAVMRSAEKVQGGKALSAAYEAEDVILPFVPQMIKIGEQSGKIDEMLGRVAQVYEDELDEQIRTISTAIEPILMVLLAVVAGGMVGAILIPIYGLVNTTGV